MATNESREQRRRVIQALAAVGALGAAGKAGFVLAQTGKIKVGFMLPYTGTYAALGRAIENGFKLYVKEQGGKLGGRELTTGSDLDLFVTFGRGDAETTDGETDGPERVDAHTFYSGAVERLAESLSIEIETFESAAPSPSSNFSTSIGSSTSSDEDGRFVFDNVPPDVAIAPEFADVGDQLERKISGIALYESQMDRLFGGTKDMARQVRAYGRKVALLGGGSGAAERVTPPTWRRGKSPCGAGGAQACGGRESAQGVAGC